MFGIGRSKNLLVFENVTSLPFRYGSHWNCWIGINLLVEKLKIVWIIDNCPVLSIICNLSIIRLKLLAIMDTWAHLSLTQSRLVGNFLRTFVLQLNRRKLILSSVKVAVLSKYQFRIQEFWISDLLLSVSYLHQLFSS